MTESSTLALESVSLIIGAIAVAAAGVLYVRLSRPGPSPTKEVEPDAEKPSLLRTNDSIVGARTAIATAVLALVLWLVPSTLGSFKEVLVAFLAGSLVTTLLAVFATHVAARSELAILRDAAELLSVPANRRRSVAGVAVAAGVGGASLIGVVGLFVLFGGSPASILGAVFGASVAAVGVWWVPARGGSPTPDQTQGMPPASAVDRSEGLPLPNEAGLLRASHLGVPAAANALVSIILSATGAMLMAAVSPTVRILYPNAVAFPLAEAAVVLLATLIALPMASFATDQRNRFVPAVGAAGLAILGSVVLIGLFMNGDSTVLASVILGLIVATLLSRTAVRSESRVRGVPSDNGGTSGTEKQGRTLASSFHGPKVIAIPASIAAVGIAAVFWIAGSGFRFSTIAFDPAAGFYGVGIASVAASAFAAVAVPLGTLRFGGSTTGRQASPDSSSMELGTGAGLSREEIGVGESLTDPAALRTLSLAVGLVVLIELLLVLAPTESGFSSPLFQSEIGSSIPYVVGGGVVGVLALVAARSHRFAGMLASRQGRSMVSAGPSSDRDHRAEGSGRPLSGWPQWGIAVVLGVGSPIVVGFVAGPFALFGFLIASLSVGVGLSLRAAERREELDELSGETQLSRAGRGPPSVSLVALTSAASIVFSGLLFGRSLLGHP